MPEINFKFFIVKRLMFCVACCGVLFFTAEAQDGNLVPNPGFEDRIECIYNDSDVTDAPPWFSPTSATPDVFHECAVVNEVPCPYPEIVDLDPWFFGSPTNTLGCQSPYEGSGYAGALFLHPGVSPQFEYREYLCVKLNSALEAGETYEVQYYVSLSERSMVGIWNLSAAFSYDSLIFDESHIISIYPPEIIIQETQEILDDTNAWTEITLEYEANGGEQYFYIGNFESNINIEFEYVIDEEDWPQHFQDAAYYYIDNVSVREVISNGSTESQLESLSFYPSICKDILMCESKFPTVIRLFDATGKNVMELNVKPGKNSFNLSHLVSGIYYLNAFNEHHIWTQKIIRQ